MELFGGRIAVTVAELTSGEDGERIMTYANYKKLAIRGSLTVLRPGKGLDHPPSSPTTRSRSDSRQNSSPGTAIILL